MANATGDQAQKRVQVIERTMEVLKALSFHSDGLTLTALSEEVNLHKATVSRFLGALEKSGMVERSEANKAWTLGPAMFEMTARAARRKDLRDVARPVMEQLSKNVEQTVQLGILVDNHIFYVEKIEPVDLALKLNTTIGSTRPIHCTALGKILAADLAEEDVLRILEEEGLEVKTEKTIRTPSSYLDELRKVRQDGYAIDDGEYNRLVICVAAPVRDAAGKVVAGLSSSTVGQSVDSELFQSLVAATVSSAHTLSHELGFRKETA